MVFPVFPLCQKGNMGYQGEHQKREISPRTKQNFYHAYARSFTFQESVYFVNFHTDQFHLIPARTTEETQWWDLSLETCPVKIVRLYWLWWGIAKVTPI